MPRRHALFLALAQLGVASSASAVTITVNSTSDGMADDGVCTLREAIENANSDSQNGRTAEGECAAGSDADEIQLPATQTISLLSALPSITAETTLTGNDARVERSTTLTACTLDDSVGGDEFPVLSIVASELVTISDVTLANGCGDSAAVTEGGGGIRNTTGPLTLNNVTLSGNSARNGGGLSFATAASAALTVNNSRFENNTASRYGAGIHVRDFSSESDVFQTDFSNNSATLAGGAIDGRGTLTLSRSTLRNNYSGDVGGGLRHNGTLVMLNSTLSANTAFDVGGGVFAEGGSLDFDDNTLIDNIGSGGTQIATPGTQAGTIDRTLFVGSGDHCDTPFAISGNNNLSTNNTNCAGSARVSRELLMIGALADNGGPTLTHALGGGSIAIDAGGVGCSATDQRGVLRPFDGNGDGNALCDIGAFESDRVAPSGPNFVVNALGDAGDGFCDPSPNDCTLRDAILSANGDGAASTISFDPTVFASAQTISLTQGELRIARDLILNGPGAELLTVDAQDASRHFLINPLASSDPDIVLSLGNLKLINGLTSGDTAEFGGGAIGGRGQIVLHDLVLEDNEDTSDGGGAINLIGLGTDPQLSLSNIQARRNLGVGKGGAAHLRGDSVSIAGSVFESNTASAASSSAGGGVRVQVNSGVIDIADSTFSSNRSVSSSNAAGGGLSIGSNGSDITLQRLALNDNAAIGVGADGLGGGIEFSVRDGSLLMDDLTVSGNSATDAFGFSAAGIYLSALGDNSSTLRDSRVLNNVSDGSAGGMRINLYDSALANIERSTISGNTAAVDGGGVFSYLYYASNQLSINDSTISGNTAGRSGGGAYVRTYGTNTQFLLFGCTVTDNTADSDNNGTGDGGGLAFEPGVNGTVSLARSVVAGNADLGGDIPDWRDGGQTLVLSNSLIGSNAGVMLTEAPPSAPDNNGNRIGGPINGVIDAKLGLLSDHGGDSFTHRPAGDSPLVDAFDSCPGNDQLGRARGVDADGTPGNDCDIGAVEFVPSIFYSGFEDDLIVKRFEQRTAELSRSQLRSRLPTIGKPAVVLRAASSDGSAGLLLVHARRSGERIELQLNRFEQGEWTKGEWRAVDGDAVQLRW
ncbi:choice-of-anchor Q domain-containing protein [Pseudomarimonas arenosa]|uniref:CSLREA domain-containing protein n=1 Tax=Pseudomarimonas arenosa TaxID=2774145 RepID=A0AAW3ZIY2_9GAMM|nr:choice-of-anchor Q domain-containing protein [Pseudomarimonas arenosa]MBD8525395.1 CSLREA domain-containing protein [Pseudomarimonas arenosa]